ncbi:cryptochrome/photolyase family protein [Haloarchaeobius sp. TZWWS8]|uniref:cryptochrome/photolyase family protein n=1 Tax=Haloarchaeobius sp. TZWWS8 TaxID=3446121 RepID=UPI003EBFF63B
MQLHWHRADLRASDNRALADAAGSVDVHGAVVPIFVFDEDVLAHGSPSRVAFMLDALGSLREWYRENGSDLLIRQGDPREVLPSVAADLDATRICWNRSYSGLARRRDADVRRSLDDVDVVCEAFHDAVHHEPGSITTNEGDPYSVYTYFWKKWRDRPKAEPYPDPAPDSLVDSDALESAGLESGDLPTLADLGFDEPEASLPTAGTEAARERLVSFCDGPIYEYDERRDYPADECTSRLSVDLKWGTIGIREVFEETEAAAGVAETEPQRESVQTFQSQLAWREFYYQVLFFNPNVVSSNFKTYAKPIDWRDAPDDLQAWKDGETGYPIVDAGMRQLREEGYVHNRVRMVVASFLTKDLLIDWREGYDWYREKLVDHDTANDTGGWQWAASTGTDAQPYFRIFNPMTQGERYDPDATYIKRYVPELGDAEPSLIHRWHEASELDRAEAAPDYPDPICDHAERRERAIAMFESARGDD